MSLIKELLQHFDDAEQRLKASPFVEPALTDVQNCLHDLETIYEEAENATAAAVQAAEQKTQAWLVARFGHQSTPLPAAETPPAVVDPLPPPAVS